MSVALAKIRISANAAATVQRAISMSAGIRLTGGVSVACFHTSAAILLHKRNASWPAGKILALLVDFSQLSRRGPARSSARMPFVFSGVSKQI
jgi:hypothetical protein